MLKIILISGKAQHGKDTAAQLLKKAMEADGKRVLIAHYADLLKYLCKTYFGWNGEKDEQGRELLQRIGTNVIRKQMPDYWVRFLSEFLSLFPDEWDYVIIPDCRFPNEIEFFNRTEFDTASVRVYRPDFASTLTAEQQKHPSETALDWFDFDYYIKNDKLDVLERKLCRLYRRIKH